MIDHKENVDPVDTDNFFFGWYHVDVSYYTEKHPPRGKMEVLMSKIPHGSGIDGDIYVVWADENRMIVYLPFHHMDENGSYVGWATYAYECELTRDGEWVIVDEEAISKDLDVTEWMAEDVMSYLCETLYLALNEGRE